MGKGVSYDGLTGAIQEIQTKLYKKSLVWLGQMAQGNGAIIEEYMPRLAQLRDSIPGMYQPLLSIPSAASFTAAVNDVRRAMIPLSTHNGEPDPCDPHDNGFTANLELDKMHGAGDLIENWTGDAAKAFKSTFLDPFPSIVQNQFKLLGALRGALLAEQSMWEAARKDIAKIAEDTLKAVDAMNAMCPDQTSWTLTWDVVAAVVAISLAIPSGGASLAAGAAALTLTAVGAGAGVAADIPITEQEKPKIGGNNPFALVASMEQAIQALIESTNATERFIADRLVSMAGTVQSRQDLFVSPPPALKGMNPNEATNLKNLGYAT